MLCMVLLIIHSSLNFTAITLSYNWISALGHETVVSIVTLALEQNYRDAYVLNLDSAKLLTSIK
jgi:hypothetical protein